MSDHQCSKLVWNGWNRGPCSRKGVVEEKGQWWCRQHAPSNVEKREAAKAAKWEAEMTVLGVIEVIPCSEAAVANMDAHPVWKV